MRMILILRASSVIGGFPLETTPTHNASANANLLTYAGGLLGRFSIRLLLCEERAPFAFDFRAPLLGRLKKRARLACVCPAFAGRSASDLGWRPAPLSPPGFGRARMGGHWGSAEGVAPFVEPPRLGAKQRAARNEPEGVRPSGAPNPERRRSEARGVGCIAKISQISRKYRKFPTKFQVVWLYRHALAKFQEVPQFRHKVPSPQATGARWGGVVRPAPLIYPDALSGG